MNFVGRVVFADPLHQGRCPHPVEANATEARYEGIFRYVMQQVHSDSRELIPRFPPGRAAKLDQEKSRHGRLGEGRLGLVAGWL